MKRLEQMKETLISCVQNQISSNLHQVNAKELGEAIDMIKDLEEAIYYSTITKAMHEDDGASHKHQPMYNSMYFPPQHYEKNYYPYEIMESYPEYMHTSGSMYMGGANPMQTKQNSVHMKDSEHSSMNENMRDYHDYPMTYERDRREGSSPMYRKMYMESRELGHDNTKKMQELENYIHELSSDIMEMIEQATQEEKQLMRQKITALATKIK